MPKSSFPLKSVRDSKRFRAIDINSHLYCPLVYALFGTVFFAFLFSFSFFDYPYPTQIVGGIFFLIILYLPTLVLVTELKYRACHRYPCAILLKAIRNESILAKPIFFYLNVLYKKLGGRTSREDVASLCFVYTEYQEYIGQQTRGKVAQRVAAIANFFPDPDKYDTIRRHFITLAEEGREYIIES